MKHFIILLSLLLTYHSTHPMLARARGQIHRPRPVLNYQNRMTRRQSYSSSLTNLTSDQAKQYRDTYRTAMRRSTTLSLASLGVATATSFEVYLSLEPTPCVASFGDGSHMIPIFALLAGVSGVSSIINGLKALDHRDMYLQCKKKLEITQ